MPLSAVIVDDEQLARDELAYLLKNIGDVDVVAQGKNGVEAVGLIREHSPDLVFLDVQMPGLDGFGVIKKLIDKKIRLPKIVFATAFDQYAVKAFEVNAVDYLLKPFDRERVAQSVQKARAKMDSAGPSSEKLETLVRLLEAQKPQPSKVLLKAAGRMFLVSQKDICFASIEEGIISVVTAGVNGMEGQSNCRTLEELLESLQAIIAIVQGAAKGGTKWRFHFRIPAFAKRAGRFFEQFLCDRAWKFMECSRPIGNGVSLADLKATATEIATEPSGTSEERNGSRTLTTP